MRRRVEGLRGLCCSDSMCEEPDVGVPIPANLHVLSGDALIPPSYEFPALLGDDFPLLGCEVILNTGEDLELRSAAEKSSSTLKSQTRPLAVVAPSQDTALVPSGNAQRQRLKGSPPDR